MQSVKIFNFSLIDDFNLSRNDVLGHTKILGILAFKICIKNFILFLDYDHHDKVY